MKVCRACGLSKDVGEFEEYKQGYRRRRCRTCCNAQRAARRAASPDSADRVRDRRRDAALERERLRAYYRTPQGRAAQRRKPSRRSGPVNLRNREYRARNRPYVRERARRATRLRRLGYDAALLAWADVLTSDPCSYCGDASSGVDHVVPLATGGANTAENFTGACFSCNREKRAQPLLLFLITRKS